MSDIVERLRSSAPLPLCPFERRSPEYYTTPNDKPCKFCGGLPDGPDKCTGADMRIMLEAADEIAKLRSTIPTADAAVPQQGMEGLLDVAEQTWVAAFKSHEDADESDPISVIYTALLAERHRCAKIAEGSAAKFDFQQALADGDDLNVGANSARLAIAQAILPWYSLKSLVAAAKEQSA